jgi:hypothetical protein
MNEEQTPIPVSRGSKAPARAKPTAQVIAESVVDLVAILVVGFLAYAGKVNADFALGLVALLAGVRLSDMLGGRGGPPGDGPAGGGGLAALVVGAVLATGETMRRVSHG